MAESAGFASAGISRGLLLDVLPGVPLLTVDSAARLINRSDVAAGSAVNRLVEAGILVQRNATRPRPEDALTRAFGSSGGGI
ncbi:MAG TPA: hypothetical protein VHG52_09450 [Thermomicrobiales bacterium]|nr:hypothetical protein [Thermomicrobiales bacterium]